MPADPAVTWREQSRSQRSSTIGTSNERSAALLSRAAFGTCPALQPTDIATALAASQPNERAAACWLAGVTLGAQGRYAAAVATLEPLLNGREAVVASLAASTLAAHHRQLGAHARARALDGRALAMLDEPTRARGLANTAARTGTSSVARPIPVADRDDARTDALLGLAADALDVGDLAVSNRLLERVTEALDGEALGGEALDGDATRPSDTFACAAGWDYRVSRANRGNSQDQWRVRVRLGWVTAEVALASGRHSDAVAPAERALGLARRVGALRHRIKSGMVLGVALLADAPDRARVLLQECLDLALRHRQLPLVWPVARVLADLEPGPPERRHGAVRDAALRAVLDAATGRMRQEARESLWLPAHVVRSGEGDRPPSESNFWTD